MLVSRVPAAGRDEPIRRNVFPAAAQAFARGSAPAVAEPTHDAGHVADDAPAAAAHTELADLGARLRDAHTRRDPDPADSLHVHDDHGWDAHPAEADDIHHDAYDHHVFEDHQSFDDHHAYEDHHAFHDGQDVFGEPVIAPAAPRRSRRFRVVIGLTLAIALFVGAALIGVQFLKPILGIDRVTDYPGPGSGSVVVTVQAGSGPAAVANSLEKAGVIADAATFLKSFAATGGSLHPGDYTFKKQMKNSDAAQILVGTSGEKVIYLALNAGMRISESLDAIAKAASVDRKDLDALNSKPGSFGLPSRAKNLEGYLAPGEYRFPIGTSATDILTKLVNTTLDTLKGAGATDPDKQYDVLTVASIVQAEGGRADYGNVAGAIYNRLKPNPETNGYIQSDATVTYGIGKKSYHITEAEKADKSNTYNTYANQGLPSGPIGSPGATAIQAAAKPTPNDYLYWVTVNLDTGETKFSKTYAEHLGYAHQYEQWCQANAGKCQ